MSEPTVAGGNNDISEWIRPDRHSYLVPYICVCDQRRASADPRKSGSPGSQKVPTSEREFGLDESYRRGRPRTSELAVTSDLAEVLRV